MSGAEIVSRRRKWTAAEKAALLAEVEAEDGRVSVVARRHGISDSLLYNWRSAWKAAISMRSPEPVEFVPIGVIGQASDEGPAVATMPGQPLLSGSRREDRVGMIEIELSSGARVRVDAFVNEKALWRAASSAGTPLLTATEPPLCA
jgi:transposase-like protein